MSGDTTEKEYTDAASAPVASAARLPLSYAVSVSTERVVVTMRASDGSFEKTVSFSPEGHVRARFVWKPALFPSLSWFTTELSLDREHTVTGSSGAEVWSHPIETVSKSERGLDHTRQGVAYLVRWPVSQGSGEVEIPLAHRSAAPSIPSSRVPARTLDAGR
jgi:Domain of unknown function (DUF1926)